MTMLRDLTDLSLTERDSAVHKAFRLAFGDGAGPWPVAIYDDYLIVLDHEREHLGPGPFYRVSYTLETDAVVFSDRDEWVEVQAEWTEVTERALQTGAGLWTPGGGDLLVAAGGAIRALGASGTKGKIGGYLVQWGSPEKRELDGFWFDPDVDLGPHDGDGAYCLFHHGHPLHPDLVHLADRTFAPLQTDRRDLGLWAETVLDLRDKFESLVYEVTTRGVLGWSPGCAPHLLKARADGGIERFPIDEGSLTPTPRQYRSAVSALRSLGAADPATLALLVQALGS